MILHCSYRVTSWRMRLPSMCCLLPKSCQRRSLPNRLADSRAYSFLCSAHVFMYYSAPPPRTSNCLPCRKLPQPRRRRLMTPGMATTLWQSTPPSSSSASRTWPTLSPCTSTHSPGSSTSTCRWGWGRACVQCQCTCYALCISVCVWQSCVTTSSTYSTHTCILAMGSSCSHHIVLLYMFCWDVLHRMHLYACTCVFCSQALSPPSFPVLMPCPS